MRKIFRKINRWMSYNPPEAMTFKGWRLFKKEFKERAPIRYWLKNDFRYNYIMPIVWKCKAISDWIRYRTYDRYHVVDTGLPPSYYDAERRLFHANFNILKDFVEVELAWRTYIWSEEVDNASLWKRKIPFYRFFKPFRSREYGLKHLDWASSLDDPSLPPNERCDHQAISSREIRELYLWWVDVYPNRKLEESPGYSDQGLGIMSSIDDDFDGDAPDYKLDEEIRERNRKLEEQWEEEDTEMLVRLVKVRGHLWT